MNRLLVFLLKDALGSAAGNQIRKSIRSLVGLVAYYATLAVFAMAAVAFLYVLIYEGLARLVTPEGAAAILCGGNLILASIMILWRKRPRSRRVPAPLNDALGHPAVSAGIALGQTLRAGVVKIAPPVLIAAAVIGLVVGVAPRLRRKRRADARNDSRGQRRTGA